MVSNPAPSPRIIRFGGDFELDLGAYELRSRGIPLKLKPIPMELLIFLVERRGELVRREEIVDRVWGKGVFLDTDNGINSAISRIRQALRDDVERPRFILTIPGKGYRFVASEVEVDEPPSALVNVKNSAQADEDSAGKIPMVIAESEPATGRPTRPPIKKIRYFAIAALLLLLVLAAAGLLRYRSLQARRLTEQDTILVADFTNNTGDSIFDETLKQAIALELTQSPFLRVASDLQVNEILRRMGRSPLDPLTHELTAEACLRLGGKAMIAGSISRLGGRYLLGLEALACSNGETLAATQAQAESKDDVLKALAHVASQMRAKLGESLPSLQKYDFPVNATTKSLEALKAFSMGLKSERDSGPNEAIPFYRQAIQIDPDFALAYATLGRAYEDFGEDQEAVRNYDAAFQRRDRLSEREKYFVTTLYYETVPGNLEKARQAGELWVGTFPRDSYAREKLGTVYGDLGVSGFYEQALEALRLDPNSETNVFNAVVAALSSDRLDDARQILQAAQPRGLNGESIHLAAYMLAFRAADMKAMDQEVAWAAGKPRIEGLRLGLHSETHAFFGRIRVARELSEKATQSASRDHDREMAANYQMVAALREIEIGNGALARKHINSALSLAPTRDVKLQAALALARSRNQAAARALLEELETQNPDNTLVKFYWGPAIQASLDLQSAQPDAAISELQAALPYEFSQAPPIGDDVLLYPTYIRGQAYLARHNGSAAAAEFQKILDHPGIAMESIIGVLARLQLARAEVMNGNNVAARVRALEAYKTFLAFWKNADPDIPILKAAKAEYANLQ